MTVDFIQTSEMLCTLNEDIRSDEVKLLVVEERDTKMFVR
jgi:hypothetical protein